MLDHCIQRHTEQLRISFVSHVDKRYERPLKPPKNVNLTLVV